MENIMKCAVRDHNCDDAIHEGWPSNEAAREAVECGKLRGELRDWLLALNFTEAEIDQMNLNVLRQMERIKGEWDLNDWGIAKCQ